MMFMGHVKVVKTMIKIYVVKMIIFNIFMDFEDVITVVEGLWDKRYDMLG